MSDRRDVRVTKEFFEQVDRLLPAERASVTPSRSDFQASELRTAVDTFRTRWEDLPVYVRGRTQ